MRRPRVTKMIVKVTEQEPSPATKDRMLTCQEFRQYMGSLHSELDVIETNPRPVFFVRLQHKGNVLFDLSFGSLTPLSDLLDFSWRELVKGVELAGVPWSAVHARISRKDPSFIQSDHAPFPSVVSEMP